MADRGSLYFLMAMTGVSKTYHLSRERGHPRTPPQSAPVRPKDAASMIIWREGADGLEVLMGRRGKKARFIPDTYVFPGGRIDHADRIARPVRPLQEHLPPHMAVRRSNDGARALAMTAVRETWEETGLLLARPGDVGDIDHTSWREMRTARQAPDLATLDYLGRAITSPYSPIRFHARFFIARADAFTGDIGGSGELSDLHFTPVERALAELPIVDVTEFMLHEVLRVTGRTPSPDRARPLFAYRRDAPFVRYD